MKNTLDKLAFGAAMAAAIAGCGGSTSSGPLDNVDALVILQRPKRNDSGDIFQYTSYIPGARLVKLEPPTADGTLTTLCCDKAGAEFANIDISGYDLSFDAKQIVFAGKLSDSTTYGLFILTLSDGSRRRSSPPTRTSDYVSPIFLPGDKIMFTTNEVVEPGAPQHEDEYERGTTTQMGIMNIDGTSEQLGPRNLSHRTAPSLASDGRVIFTQWDHLGEENAGHLMFMNTDMTELREAFGKEGTAASNSTLKARRDRPGPLRRHRARRVTAPINAGALIDIRLGYPHTDGNGNVTADDSMSEAHASYAPADAGRAARQLAVGGHRRPLLRRVRARRRRTTRSCSCRGPMARSSRARSRRPALSANFGIYLYDSVTQQRHPILDDPDMWDIFARPLQTAHRADRRRARQSDGSLDGQALIGAMNVYTSTLHTFAPGSIYGVRVMEGFSSEEGFPRDVRHDDVRGPREPRRRAGRARRLVARARCRRTCPIHLQAVDAFGMSLFNEPVWVSGRAGESRVCGGCHEDRAVTTIINPGITQAASRSARSRRYGNVAARPAPVDDGLHRATRSWASRGTRSLQPMFDAKCVQLPRRHARPGEPELHDQRPDHRRDRRPGRSTSRGQAVTLNVGGTMLETFTASYFTMAGPDMEAIEKNNLMISRQLQGLHEPGGRARLARACRSSTRRSCSRRRTPTARVHDADRTRRSTGSRT